MLQFMVYFDDLEVPPWLFGNLSPLSSWRSMRQVYWTRGSPLVKPEEILDLGWLKIALPAIHIGHPHSWVPNIWICVLVNIYLSIYLSIYIYISLLTSWFLERCLICIFRRMRCPPNGTKHGEPPGAVAKRIEAVQMPGAQAFWRPNSQLEQKHKSNTFRKTKKHYETLPSSKQVY